MIKPRATDTFRVYVTLGFHINFYHSWRGDTPDEAGFGTDIRVVRGLLEMLERANAAGLQACGYWDTEVYWSMQKILPKYAPDILEGIRRRVAAGLDEIVVGPFNNGANHAATEDEFRACVAWALENEWGSGLRQLFGRTAPIYRSQETMLTTGQEAILHEYGLSSVILYYAAAPFNTFSSFIPALSLEQRYNPLWYRSREDQPRLALLPCIAAGDLIEQVSLENLMLDLHRRQLRGEIQSDVLIHINEDADLETWLPAGLPKALAWFPNTGGLDEFIRAVNKYPWAEFCLPSQYLAAHPPLGEVLVRQDLADGGFDGNYSWAEKYSSLKLWTLLEQSRLASYRAESLRRRAGLASDPALWQSMDSAFFQRLIGLSTTHFGMSTPIINEERLDKAMHILGGARQIAVQAEQDALRACLEPADAKALYDFELYATPAGREAEAPPARTAVAFPLVLPPGVQCVALIDAHGRRLPASLTDMELLPEGRRRTTLRFVAHLPAQERLRLRVLPADGLPALEPPGLHPPLCRLRNRWLEVEFSEQNGVEVLNFEGVELGGADFLAPFISYGSARRPRIFRPEGYRLLSLDGESWDGLGRVRLQATIPMRTPEGEFVSEFTYTFTLFDHLPYLFVDVRAQFAYTPPRQLIHNMTQKLRRRMDLQWIETAPFQLTPAINAPAEKPLRIWKHNYLGITSFYDLDYGRINPRNREIDSFNHQVTAGWLALSNGAHGLLLAENAPTLASMAFCPLRLREQEGKQRLSLNPFGSYYGRQLDYSHLGGNGLGADIILAFSGALKPNGPSYNGQRLEFSLMLAPYAGDEPRLDLQNDAGAFFYPPGTILHGSPEWLKAETLEDIRAFIKSENRREPVLSGGPPSPPAAVLANPSASAVDLVWDAPREGRVEGYEIQWRVQGETAWLETSVGEVTRWRLEGCRDGCALEFRLRALRGGKESPWTALESCTPGEVRGPGLVSELRRAPLWTLARIIAASLWAQLRNRSLPR